MKSFSIKKSVKSGKDCPSEHYEQAFFVSWFRKTYETLIFSIPNGGVRDKVTAMKLKVEGTVSGVPDLFVPEWGLFIEMKRKEKSYLSKEQKKIIKILEGYGYSAIVGYGMEDAKKKVEDFRNNPLVKEKMK